MTNLIALITLLISFLGIVIIVFCKIPILVSLPNQRPKDLRILEKSFIKIAGNGFVKSISPEILLHRILSKLRALTIKTEGKTSYWLQNLRQRSIEKKKSFQDDYWKKIRSKK